TPAAIEFDAADVVDGFNDLLDSLVDDFGEFLRIASAGNGQSENRLRVGVVLSYAGRLRVARKSALDLRHLVAYVLDGRIHITFQVERDVRLYVSLVGIRAEFVDAVDGVDGFFDVFSDRRFDFFCARSRELDVHIDIGLIRLRHQIYAKGPVRENAERNQR